MMFDEGPTPSQLLESMMAFSAGLCQIKSRSKILGYYPALYRLAVLQHSFRKNFIDEPSRISIENLDPLAKKLGEFSPDDVVIASSYYGRPVAFVCTCARMGIPLALVYESIARTSAEALVRSGVVLIKLDEQGSPLSLFSKLNRIRREGRYLAMLVDVPHQTRRRYELLGYEVAVLTFAATYARRSGSSILPLFTSLMGDDRMSYSFGRVVEDVYADVTQDLMNSLRAAIERDCLQYSWTSACTIFSDPVAKMNALSFLSDVLVSRDALMNGRGDLSS